MKKDIRELYCLVEDFCKGVDENFANKLLTFLVQQSTFNNKIKMSF